MSEPSPVKLVSFDAAGTLIRVKWHPVNFPLQQLEKYWGWEVDRQVAAETHQRLAQGSLSEYWAAHQHGEQACLDYWNQLVHTWLCKISPEQPSLEEVQTFVEKSWEDFYNVEQGWFTLFEDVLPTLESLREKGYKLCMLSNWDFTLRRICDNLKLTSYFEKIYPSLEFGVEKPSPELFKIVEKDFGLSGTEILHVGDDPRDDFHGATQVGWKALLLDRVNPPSASYTIQTLSEVNAHL
jgi:HAD superfamily hydrolase (TIGR01549 family)